MAFHIDNFGSYKNNLKQYADRKGYIPEEGDDWRDMDYDLGPDKPEPSDTKQERREKIEYLDEEWWPSFKQDAIRATENAKKTLQRKRERMTASNDNNSQSQGFPSQEIEKKLESTMETSSRDLKGRLIRMGQEEPDLQNHLAVVIRHLES